MGKYMTYIFIASVTIKGKTNTIKEKPRTWGVQGLSYDQIFYRAKELLDEYYGTIEEFKIHDIEMILMKEMRDEDHRSSPPSRL